VPQAAPFQRSTRVRSLVPPQELPLLWGKLADPTATQFLAEIHDKPSRYLAMEPAGPGNSISDRPGRTVPALDEDVIVILGVPGREVLAHGHAAHRAGYETDDRALYPRRTGTEA